MRRIALLAFVLPWVASAKAETWECQSGNVWGAREILVKATSHEDGAATGTIEVAGTTHDTAYAVNGFNRQWSWEQDPELGRYSYSFVLQPAGDADYFDYQGASARGETTTTASQQFVCRDLAANAEAGGPSVPKRLQDLNLEEMSDEDLQAWLEEGLPAGYITKPETIAECATNRDLFRAEQLKSLVAMNEFLDADALVQLAMSSEDLAHANYESCVASVECVEELGAEVCARIIIEAFSEE